MTDIPKLQSELEAELNNADRTVFSLQGMYAKWARALFDQDITWDEADNPNYAVERELDARYKAMQATLADDAEADARKQEKANADEPEPKTGTSVRVIPPCPQNLEDIRFQLLNAEKAVMRSVRDGDNSLVLRSLAALLSFFREPDRIRAALHDQHTHSDVFDKWNTRAQQIIASPEDREEWNDLAKSIAFDRGTNNPKSRKTKA